MEKAFGHFARVFDHERFLDLRDKQSERQRWHAIYGTQTKGLVAHLAQKTLGVLKVDVGMDRVAAGFAKEDVIGFVLLEDVEDDFGGPLDLAERFLFPEEVAVNHHAGLRGVAEVNLEQIRTGEGFVEVVGETVFSEEQREFLFGKDLLGPDGKNEAVVVGGGDGVAAAQATQAERNDAGERLVAGAADERVEEIMSMAAGRQRAFGRAALLGSGNSGSLQFAGDGFALVEEFLDEKKIRGGDLGYLRLSEVHPGNDTRVDLAAVESISDPLGQFGFAALLEALPKFAAKRDDLFGDFVGERHFVGVPAWDGRDGLISAGDEAFHHAGAFEANGAAGDDEDVADLERAEEGFLDETVRAGLELHSDDAFVGDNADILEEVALDAAGMCLERVGAENDFAEGLAVLLLERFATAGKVIEHIVEILLCEISEGIGPADQSERFGPGPFADATHADQMLRENIEGQLWNANFIEPA